MYERPRVNVKVEVQLFRLHVTFHTSPLFYLRAQNLRGYARKNYATVKIPLNKPSTVNTLLSDHSQGSESGRLIEVLYPVIY